MSKCGCGSCNYDYDRSWDYECHRSYRRDRREHRRVQHAWDYSGW